ncbi:MAG: hypothetical protein DHS20C17_00980 [Cyclobacteriaceae bacterium]|nr:MAG: hypothetical protein DHS20C17_00980 [Cyclobacteriaceae bacterium]
MFSTCDHGFEELNINPNQSENDPSLDLLFGSILPGFIGQVIGQDGNPVTGNGGTANFGGELSQQFANKNSEVGRLSHDENAFHWVFWFSVYSENGGAMRNIAFLIEEAAKQENEVYMALGLIYKAFTLGYTTDLFGDVPYIDAGKGFLLEDQYLFPKFDPQQEIYKAMLNDLETANSLLASAPSNQLIDSNRDLLFAGDRMAWRKFANSLRIRILMRMSNVEDVGSRVAEIFNSPDSPVLEGVKDEPSFSFSFQENWPYSLSNDPNNEKRLSATMVDILNGEGGVNKVADVRDPRLPVFVNPTIASIANGSPEYVGQPVGLISDFADDDERSMLTDYVRELNTVWLLTYADLLLLKAEAVHRGMISGDVTQIFEDGVKASLDRFGIDLSVSETTDFLASIKSNFSGNELKHIAIQRWIDNIFQGMEGYAIWRRTDFPILVTGPDATFDETPTRYSYTSHMLSENGENVNSAVNRAPLNGLNTSFNKVWWDQ